MEHIYDDLAFALRPPGVPVGTGCCSRSGWWPARGPEGVQKGWIRYMARDAYPGCLVCWLTDQSVSLDLDKERPELVRSIDAGTLGLGKWSSVEYM